MVTVKQMKKFSPLVLAAVLWAASTPTASTAAQSTEPTTAPAEQRARRVERRDGGNTDRAPAMDRRPDRMRPRVPGGGGMGPGGIGPGAGSGPGGEWRRDWPGMPQPMSDEERTKERADLEQFMKTYSPKRWERFQDIPDDRRDNVLRAARNQYRWMQRLKQDDPRVYEIRLKRLPIEDDIFALSWEARHGTEAKAGAEEQRSRLRERVRAFVGSCLEERRIRLERMQERLRQQQANAQAEEAALKKATGNLDALVEEGMDAVENERLGALKDLAAPIFRRATADAPGAPAPGETDEPAPAAE